MAMGQKLMGVTKGLIVSYILTVILLFITAVIVYKTEISDSVLNAVIVAVYIICTFVGGLVTGKAVKEKRFLWGAVYGVMYILIALAVSAVLGGSSDGAAMSCITKCIMCVAGGMLGAMLS